MFRLLCGAALLLATAVACGGEIRCDIKCSETGATVQRTFSSCSALRQDFDSRVASDRISECEAAALESCIKEQCANSPL